MFYEKPFFFYHPLTTNMSNAPLTQICYHYKMCQSVLFMRTMYLYINVRNNQLGSIT